MSYELIDSLKDELAFLKKTLENHVKHYPNGILWKNIYNGQIRSLERTISRYEDGIDYEFYETETGYKVRKIQTTRHLERDFPEITDSAQAHKDLIAQAEMIKKMKDE